MINGYYTTTKDLIWSIVRGFCVKILVTGDHDKFIDKFITSFGDDKLAVTKDYFLTSELGSKVILGAFQSWRSW